MDKKNHCHPVQHVHRASVALLILSRSHWSHQRFPHLTETGRQRTQQGQPTAATEPMQETGPTESPTTNDQTPSRLSTRPRLPARRRALRALYVYMRRGRLPGMETMQDPTPVEIREQCLRIQDGWSAKERVRRAPWWAAEQAVEFPRWAAADWLAVDDMKA